jgi:ribosomal protein S18 acetylase RimI-like enzyme
MIIQPVQTPEQIDRIRRLFEEYWTSFGFTPCFQGFGDELAGLPGDYAPPGGRLALSTIGGEPAGCIAMRRLDEARCEMKRLYVRDQFRGAGLGRSLLRWLVEEARQAGYREIVCDTMPVMERAITMYARAGFEQTGPYAASPAPGAVFLRLQLE